MPRTPTGATRRGPEQIWSKEILLSYFPSKEQAASIHQIAKIVQDSYGMPYSTFHKYKNELHNAGLIIPDGGIWYLANEKDRTPQPPAHTNGTSDKAATDKTIPREPSWIAQEFDHMLEAFPIGEANARELVEIKYFVNKRYAIHFGSFPSLRREMEKLGAIHCTDAGTWYRVADFAWRDADGKPRRSYERPCPLPAMTPEASTPALVLIAEQLRNVFCDFIDRAIKDAKASKPAATLTNEDHFA